MQTAVYVDARLGGSRGSCRIGRGPPAGRGRPTRSGRAAAAIRLRLFRDLPRSRRVGRSVGGPERRPPAGFLIYGTYQPPVAALAHRLCSTQSSRRGSAAQSAVISTRFSCTVWPQMAHSGPVIVLSLAGFYRVIGSHSVRWRFQPFRSLEIAGTGTHPALYDVIVGREHPPGFIVVTGVPRIEIYVTARSVPTRPLR